MNEEAMDPMKRPMDDGWSSRRSPGSGRISLSHRQDATHFSIARPIFSEL